MAEHREQIVLDVNSGKNDLSGLNATLEKLGLIDAKLADITAKYKGLISAANTMSTSAGTSAVNAQAAAVDRLASKLRVAGQSLSEWKRVSVDGTLARKLFGNKTGTLTHEVSYDAEGKPSSVKQVENLKKMEEDRRKIYTEAAETARKNAKAYYAGQEAGYDAWNRERGGRKGPIDPLSEFRSSLTGNAAFETRRSAVGARQNLLAGQKAERHEGYIGSNMVSNIKKVAAWTTSLGVFYGITNAVTGAVKSMVELEYSTARLMQVFQHGKGEVRGMVSEILRLSAANGRSSKEAMEAAISWSRLGLNRLEVIEATRVSLVAANVAEITAAQATEHLAAVMSVYGIRATELNGVLGMLNQTSNTWRVTNKALFEGIGRTASAAKQAGIPLAELIGLIGAGVGATGQSGANIGNSLKSFIGSVSSPDKAKMLREQYNIETTDTSGELKNMSTLLADLFIQWQKLSNAERQSMIFNVSGKHQASRIIALLDNYIKAQSLAIAAQLNLNSAQEENKLITNTLKSTWAGMTTELERFVNLQGNLQLVGGSTGGIGGIGVALKNATGAARGMVSMFNAFPNLAAGAIGLVTALGIRLAVTSWAMKDTAKSGGILQNTFKQVKVEGMAMKNLLFTAVQQQGGWAKQMYNAGQANMIAGNKLAGGAQKAGSAMLVAGKSAGTFAVILAGLELIMWSVAAGSDALGLTSSGMDASLEKLTRRADKAKGAWQAASMQIRLANTTEQALANQTSPSERTKLFGAAAEAFEPDRKKRDALIARYKEIEMLDDSARKGATASLMSQLNTRFQADKVKWRAEQMRVQSLNEGVLQNEIERLRKSPLASKKSITDKEAQLVAVRGQSAQLLQEEIDDQKASLELWIESNAELQAFKRSLDAITSSAKRMTDALPGETETDRLQKQQAGLLKTVAAYEQQLAVVQKLQRDSFRSEGSSSFEQLSAKRDALMDEGRKMQADAVAKFSETTGRNPSAGDIARISELKDSAPNYGQLGYNVPAIIGLRSSLKAAGSKFTEAASIDSQLAGASDPDGGALRKSLQARERMLIQALDKVRPEMLSAMDPTTSALADLYTTRNAGSQFTGARIDASGTGESAGARLISSQSWIQGQINQTRAGNGMWADSDQRDMNLLQLETALIDKKAQAELRVTEIIKEQTDERIRATREFEKSLLGSGPGELLRKMAAGRLSQGGMNAGQFFAMGTEMRADIRSMPGNTDDEVNLRRERAALERAGFGRQTQGQFQNMILGGAKSRAALQNALSPDQQAPAITKEMVIVIDQLNTKFTNFGNTLDVVTTKLKSMGAAVPSQMR